METAKQIIEGMESTTNLSLKSLNSINWETFETEKRQRELTEESCLPIRHADFQANAIVESAMDNARRGIRLKAGTGYILALIGQRGTGKTQMAVDECKAQIMRCRRSLYVLSMDIFIDLKGAYKKKTDTAEADIISKYTRPSLLVIDEITQRGETDWENRMLVHILDKRYAAKKDTMLIGNLTANDLKGNVGASVISRLNETGGIIECNWKSFRA